MYFTRVYNPVWTNPDGLSWIEVLTRRGKIGLHACLTPTWSETAWFADYVLPMGHGSERHDLSRRRRTPRAWIGFRQPVLREVLRRAGREFEWTWQAHEASRPAQVWEEDEFWIELSWRIDPDGRARHPQVLRVARIAPARRSRSTSTTAGSSRTRVPGLPEAAQKEGLDAARRTCASTARS